MNDRFTEITCSGDVGDLFQNNRGDSENPTALVFFPITDMKCLFGLIAIPLRFIVRKGTLSHRMTLSHNNIGV